MLTKQDLSEIGSLIDRKFKSELGPINSKISTIQKDIVKIRADQKEIIRFFDKEFLN